MNDEKAQQRFLKEKFPRSYVGLAFLFAALYCTGCISVKQNARWVKVNHFQMCSKILGYTMQARGRPKRDGAIVVIRRGNSVKRYEYDYSIMLSSKKWLFSSPRLGERARRLLRRLWTLKPNGAKCKFSEENRDYRLASVMPEYHPCTFRQKRIIQMLRRLVRHPRIRAELFARILHSWQFPFRARFEAYRVLEASSEPLFWAAPWLLDLSMGREGPFYCSFSVYPDTLLRRRIGDFLLTHKKGVYKGLLCMRKHRDKLLREKALYYLGRIWSVEEPLVKPLLQVLQKHPSFLEFNRSLRDFPQVTRQALLGLHENNKDPKSRFVILKQLKRFGLAQRSTRIAKSR